MIEEMIRLAKDLRKFMTPEEMHEITVQAMNDSMGRIVYNYFKAIEANKQMLIDLYDYTEEKAEEKVYNVVRGMQEAFNEASIKFPRGVR
jgi:hypothetical protein